GPAGSSPTTVASPPPAPLCSPPHLAPFPDQVAERFDAWLLQQRNAGRTFTDEQLDWLRLIRDHIAASLSIGPRELLDPPFSQRGGLGRARELFGQELDALLTELTEAIAA
ncbi:MAG: type I restriction-modification enzyme R subunit C-terminal domain-containing protein, partial [Acidimicrobiales bacterium]